MKIYTYQGKKNVSGEKIRQMRNMKRMSQSALAAKMQVEGVMLERDSISRIEGGCEVASERAVNKAILDYSSLVIFR